ncbi:uncharacterized protein LOC112505982 [Cynara cardunculus var. scolymus]|uniref:uncharacterized protein LOC112505982 n=1 Tax=Cynara cardunculus var. scolymus TaxID=59895 RepID=UPI000D6253BF|nr:uncharacterized protein LOC112505982 [Cynara cardunculus var. scolymus]
MSISKDMFLETLSLIGDCNEDVVDESIDVSKKKQMEVVLRYVDARGKRARLYDGASNMRGEFNGLKALILNENSSTYYIHCFAHQLQLVVVAVANKHDGVENFFNMLGMVINVVNASCKRKDMLRQSYKDRVQEAIGKCEIDTGTGKYQELSLIRAEDTWCGSHYKTILSLIVLFSNVVEVLWYDEEDRDNGFSRTQATALSPCDSFSQFNVSDLLKLSELYPQDFSHMERIALEKQLNMYYLIVRQDERFANLSVATATVERCFSAMKIVKSDLRNKIGDEFLNAPMICTIEKEALLTISNDDGIFASYDRWIYHGETCDVSDDGDDDISFNENDEANDDMNGDDLDEMLSNIGQGTWGDSWQASGGPS